MVLIKAPAIRPLTTMAANGTMARMMILGMTDSIIRLAITTAIRAMGRITAVTAIAAAGTINLPLHKIEKPRLRRGFLL